MKHRQAVYDDVSHEWDEQVSYKILPRFRNCYVFYPNDLRVHKYETQCHEVMKELLQAIQNLCLFDEE